jgi:hypothetical protein
MPVVPSTPAVPFFNLVMMPTVGPDAWAARFLVKETLSLIADSATINQLTTADAGVSMSGKLLDTNANGVADHIQLTLGGKTLDGTLQSAGTSWKLYYNVERGRLFPRA